MTEKSELGAQEPMSWQPIETAPKDAQYFILLWCPEDSSRWFASWQDHRWCGVDDFGLTRDGASLGDPDVVTGWFVSHWQHLPAPPPSGERLTSDAGDERKGAAIPFTDILDNIQQMAHAAMRCEADDADMLSQINNYCLAQIKTLKAAVIAPISNAGEGIRVTRTPSNDQNCALAAAPAPSKVRETIALRENLREAWAALAMIRETVEILGPVGAVAASEHLDGPTFMHEAEALVAGIRSLAAQPPVADGVRKALDRDSLAIKIAEVSRDHADGYRRNISNFNTSHDNIVAEKCSIAASNTGWFLMNYLGYSSEEIKKAVAALAPPSSGGETER